MNRVSMFFALICGALSLAACGGQTAADVSEVSVSPKPFGVQRTNAVKLTANATMHDGTTQDVSSTSATAWSSADETTAIVDEHGVVLGVKEGVTLINVTFEGMSDSVLCTVIP